MVWAISRGLFMVRVYIVYNPILLNEKGCMPELVELNSKLAPLIHLGIEYIVTSRTAW